MRSTASGSFFLNGYLNLVRLSHSGCLLVLRKPLLVGYCIVMWILVGAFSIFSIQLKNCRRSSRLAQLIRNRTARKKRTAKRSCDKRDRAITCMFCRNLHL